MRDKSRRFDSVNISTYIRSGREIALRKRRTEVNGPIRIPADWKPSYGPNGTLTFLPSVLPPSYRTAGELRPTAIFKILAHLLFLFSSLGNNDFTS